MKRLEKLETDVDARTGYVSGWCAGQGDEKLWSARDLAIHHGQARGARVVFCDWSSGQTGQL